MMPLNSKRWCRCVILIHRTSTLLTSQPTKRMEVAVLQHSCCISHWCGSAQGGVKERDSALQKRQEEGALGCRHTAGRRQGWAKPRVSFQKEKKKRKRTRKGKQGTICSCGSCEMLRCCWDRAEVHCPGDAALQHQKQRPPHTAGMRLSPNSCKDREQRCSSVKLCFVYA